MMMDKQDWDYIQKLIEKERERWQVTQVLRRRGDDAWDALRIDEIRPNTNGITVIVQ